MASLKYSFTSRVIEKSGGKPSRGQLLGGTSAVEFERSVSTSQHLTGLDPLPTRPNEQTQDSVSQDTTASSSGRVPSELRWSTPGLQLTSIDRRRLRNLSILIDLEFEYPRSGEIASGVHNPQRFPQFLDDLEQGSWKSHLGNRELRKSFSKVEPAQDSRSSGGEIRA